MPWSWEKPNPTEEEKLIDDLSDLVYHMESVRDHLKAELGNIDYLINDLNANIKKVGEYNDKNN